MRKISYCQSFPWKKSLRSPTKTDTEKHSGGRQTRRAEAWVPFLLVPENTRPLAILTLLLLLANRRLLNLRWMDLGKLNENSLIVSGWRLLWSPPPPQEQNGPPTPNLVQMSSCQFCDDVTYAPGGHEEVYGSHNEAFWGEQDSLPSRSGMGWESRERTLAGVCGV